MNHDEEVEVTESVDCQECCNDEGEDSYPCTVLKCLSCSDESTGCSPRCTNCPNDPDDYIAKHDEEKQHEIEGGIRPGSIKNNEK